MSGIERLPEELVKLREARREQTAEHDFTELGTRDQITSWLGALARAGQLTEVEIRALLEAAYAEGRIVDLDPDDPWSRAFKDLAKSAAAWSRRDAAPTFTFKINRRAGATRGGRRGAGR